MSAPVALGMVLVAVAASCSVLAGLGGGVVAAARRRGVPVEPGSSRWWRNAALMAGGAGVGAAGLGSLGQELGMALGLGVGLGVGVLIVAVWALALVMVRRRRVDL